MAFCVSCGKAMDEASRFCNHCGTPSAADGGASEASAPDPFKTVVKDAPAYGVVNLEQLPEGHLIDDRYEVTGKLGQGGFGAVYRVFDRKMECDKALKVLPEAVASDIEAMEGIRREAVTMAKLNHPNIVRIFEFQDKGAVKYIDMELVEGRSLTEVKLEAPDKSLDETTAVGFAVGIAKGLAYAHGQGVIHKDIKPQNILVNAAGEPKITDFGISETVKSSMSRIANSSSSGTLVYMAPEQIRGKDVGRESDIYSFGALLYELLSGHPPFYTGAIEHQILNESVERLQGVSESLNRFVLRCLEKEYSDRYRNFDEVLAALDGKTVPKGSKPGVSAEPEAKASGKTMWMGAAVVVVLVVAAGVYGLVGKGSATPDDEVVTAPVIAIEKSEAPVSPPVIEISLETKIENSWEKLGGLETRISAMKSRLDSGSTREGDSMSAMLGLIKEKAEVSQALSGLEQEQRDGAARKARVAREAQYQKLKHEVDVFEALIATEEGKSLKEAAWKELVGKFPEESGGVAPYDSAALLDGGWLTITPSPADATVRVLNIKAVYAPGMKLGPGDYNVEVACDGYVATRKTVTLARAEVKKVAVGLKAQPTLTIQTTPGNAHIVLKGTPEKYSPGMMLAPGNYTVVVTAKSHVAAKRDVRLAAGEKKRVKVDLVPFGRLTVDTEPAGAHVVLLGIKEKYNPGVPLASGEYRVLVKAKDHIPKEQTVKVGAGKSTSVKVALQKAKLTNSLGMEFVYIKPGTFMIGSSSGEPGRGSDEKQHRVTLSNGYYLQATEVTQGQWKAVMGSNPSKFSSCGDNCPVEQVSWEDAQRFIKKLNAREGGKRYRLPTEGEWEYACRAGSKTPYANGKSLSSLGWYDDNSGNKTHPVAQKASNAWGLYDMHGNVYEWCQDWKGDYPSSHVTDPVGPSSGSRRVNRGGSWYSNARYCRSAFRSYDSPGRRRYSVGLRLLRTL